MPARLSLALTVVSLAAARRAGAGQAGVARAANATGQVVLISQGEALEAYNIDTGAMHQLVPPAEFVNGPPCFIPGDTQGRFVEADDNPNETWTGPSGAENGDAQPFFGLFDRNGARDHDAAVGDAGRVGAESGMKDPAGCAFDASGNLFGVGVGTRSE